MNAGPSSHGDEFEAPPDGRILESVAAEPAETEPFPWPPGEDESVATAAIETWRGASLHPARFFRAMPRAGPLGPALLYYLPLGVIAEGLDLFWRVVLGPLTPEPTSAIARLAAQTQGMRPLVNFLISPAYLLAGLILTAAIVHVALVILGGARHGFRSTARVACYAYSPAVLAVIPWVGWLFASVWMLVLFVVGLREAHGTSGLRAAAAVLLPVLGFAALITMVLVLMMAGVLMMPVY